MFMSVFMNGNVRVILTIIVLIVMVWILFRFRATRNPVKTSLDLLQERYEKGEMTKEEFEAARKKQIKID